jgi:hypothetical protein
VAVELYRQAMLALYDYENIVMEHGLVAELKGPRLGGDDNILDRLTLCLFRLGRYKDLADAVADSRSSHPRLLFFSSSTSSA